MPLVAKKRILDDREDEQKFEKTERKKNRRSEQGERANEKKRQKKIGWLHMPVGTIDWPRTLRKIPCKNYATVGRACHFSSCNFSHEKFPEAYTYADKKTICHVVDNADNAKFHSSVNVADLENLRSGDGQPNSSSATTPSGPAENSTPE